jgi:hypothetical protein
MKKVEIHPLSVTIGAVVAFFLLFACSSSGSSSALVPTVPSNVTTQVTFHADTYTGLPQFGTYNASFTLGSTVATTVITDFSWTGDLEAARLLVNGTPVYSWGFGGNIAQTFSGGAAYAFAIPSRFSLSNGIKVPTGAALTVELASYRGVPVNTVSLAGYTL